jgi:CheY-like chemotaxis protein
MNQTAQKVLIVDDEESLLTVLSTKFTEEGITVLTAENGKKALEVAFAEHPDVIVLDIMMPEMDGFDVMKHLQEDEWGKTVPIILLTNSSSFDTISKAVSSGMSEFIVKTELKLDEVVNRVKQRLTS